MIRRIIFWAVIFVVGVGCAGPAEQPESVVEPVTVQPPATPLPPTPTSRPTATPTLPPTATLTPLPTATAQPTRTPTPTATSQPVDDILATPLDQVWLPFGFGAYGEPLLAVRDGELVDIDEPPAPPIEAFFDSHPAGRMLYGAEFWEAAANDTDSVTDLWLASKAFEGWSTPPIQLFEGDVGRAAFNPASEMGWPVAVAVHDGVDFDLILHFGNGDQLTAAEGIDPFFSWSPDGEQIAYVKSKGLYLFDPISLATVSLELNLRDAGFGWVGDAPVWDIERGVIFYPADPFLVVPLPDNPLEIKDPFVPQLLDDDSLYYGRPSRMLWSPELRQLIVQQEDVATEIQIILLTSDLAQVQDIYYLENATLVGWYAVGRSIIIIDDFGDPVVWDLVEEEFIATPNVK